jgi:signal transduction histidine kinase
MSSSGQFTQAILSNNPSTTHVTVESLNAMKTFDGVWDSLFLLNSQANTVVTTDSQLLAPAERAVLKSAIDQALTGDTTSTDVFSDSAGNPAQYFFSPIRASGSGAVVGVIGGNVAWQAVLEITRSLKDGSVLLVNQKGVEIGNNDFSPTSDILKDNLSDSPAFQKIAASKESSGSFITDEFEGVKQPLVAYSKEPGYLDYSGHGWYLINKVATAQIFAPTRRVTVSLLTVSGSIMLLALGLVLVFMQRQVIRPIQSLSDALEGIARGDWSHRVRLKSNDELGNLGKAFNTMASQLSSANDQLTAEKARLESSINSLPLGFMLTDKANGIITTNPLMRKMTNAKNTQSPERKSDNLREMVLNESAHCLSSQKPASRDYTTATGRFIKLLFSPVVVGSGKAIGVVTLAEDITEAKVLERSKDEFFSIASHELRTPLTAIRGNASMIQKFYAKDLKDPSVNEMVDDIKEASIRLIDIVNDFLDASKLEQGKMTLASESFDISEVIESVVYEMSTVVSEKRLFLKADKTLHTLPHVYADKNRVKQIIYNLLGNALKFTDKGGISITAQKAGHQLRITVSDTGRGIPADKQALLFRKFQQAGNDLLTRDSTRGTGMGLYISKLLVEEMGGKLTLDSSSIEQGTSFSFYLPLSSPTAGSSKTPNPLA